MFFAGGMIPNYVLIAQALHMRDTMWAIIIPGAISTYNVLIMKSFFAGLPNELEEAASIDGMNAYGIFVKIIIPLSKPILASMFLFTLLVSGITGLVHSCIWTQKINGQWHCICARLLWVQPVRKRLVQAVTRQVKLLQMFVPVVWY